MVEVHVADRSHRRARLRSIGVGVRGKVDVVAADKDEVGRAGEQAAADHLQRTGLVIVERNWRCPEGEIDIVAEDGDTLVVCEVKTRSGLGFGDPSEAVVGRKAARLRRLALRWLAEHGQPWRELRFDVVSVLWPRDGEPVVRHLPGAF